MEAFFWGQDDDSDSNYQRYLETLAVIRKGLSSEYLTFQGNFHQFDNLPMRLGPVQKPFPPMWYMRNAETAALEGMNTVIVGTLESLKIETQRYQQIWKSTHGEGSLNKQGQDPKIGLVVHMVVADTDEEAISIASPAWDKYKWNLYIRCSLFWHVDI